MVLKHHEYVGFSLSEESLRIAHLRVSESIPEVLHISKRDVKNLSEEKLAAIVKDVIKEFRSKNPGIVCMISPALATTRNIEIPSLDPKEIRAIVDLQAGRHTPYSREEILLGYINFGVYQRNYSKVFLVVINRELVKKQIHVFEDGGFEVEQVLFPPEGIMRFYSKVLGLKSQSRPTGILHIGHRSTDFIVGFRGVVMASRGFPVGLTHLMSAEHSRYREQFLDELKKSIESYQNEEIDNMPETFLVTTDYPKIKEMLPALEDVLKSKVKLEPYWKYLRTSRTLLKSLTEPNDESFLDIIAPVNMAAEAEIDLLPEETRIKKAIAEQGRQMGRFAVLALLLLILGALTLFTQIYFKNNYLNNLRNSYASQREEVGHLEEISTKTAIIRGFMDRRLVMLDVMLTLQSILPDAIYLENLSVDEEGEVVIRGISESMSRVFGMVTALEESALFKSVKTRSTAAKRQAGRDVATFEISCRIEGLSPARPEQDLEEE
jgi:Tfp pilus assembly protein PilN